MNSNTQTDHRVARAFAKSRARRPFAVLLLLGGAALIAWRLIVPSPTSTPPPQGPVQTSTVPYGSGTIVVTLEGGEQK